jgi:hypothetical protein
LFRGRPSMPHREYVPMGCGSPRIFCCAFVTSPSFVSQKQNFPIAVGSLADHSRKD